MNTFEKNFREKLHKYNYKGDWFDSPIELQFWIYSIENNIDLKRNWGKITYEGFIPTFIQNKGLPVYVSRAPKNAENKDKFFPICRKYKVRIIDNQNGQRYINYIHKKYGYKFLSQFRKRTEKEYKRKIIDAPTFEQAYPYRNKNVKFSYICKSCGNKTIINYLFYKYFNDGLCKYCRKKNKKVCTN